MVVAEIAPLYKPKPRSCIRSIGGYAGNEKPRQKRFHYRSPICRGFFCSSKAPKKIFRKFFKWFKK